MPNNSKNRPAFIEVPKYCPLQDDELCKKDLCAWWKYDSCVVSQLPQALAGISNRLGQICEEMP